MISIRKPHASIAMCLLFLAAAAGCNVVVLPEGICEGEETDVDGLTGQWTLDTGHIVNTRPVAITQIAGTDRYHIESIPPGGIDQNFRLCPLDKGSYLLEQEIGLEESPGTRPALRLSRLKHDDVRWVVEKVDGTRADFTGLSVTNVDPPGQITELVTINTPGAPLLDFLTDAPYQFVLYLRR